MFLAIVGWPIVVVACTALARKGLRILAFLLSVVCFPLSALVANLLVQSGSPSSLSREYALTSAFTATMWVLVVIVMVIAAVTRKGKRHDA
jgi:hypothetical protein